MSDVDWHQYMVDNADVPASIAAAVMRRYGDPVKSVTAIEHRVQERRCECAKLFVETGRTVKESEADGITYAVRWDWEYCPQCKCAWYRIPETRRIV